LLGAAGEKCGLDRGMKSNTSAEYAASRSPKTLHGDRRKRGMAITENGPSRSPKTVGPITENGLTDRLT
jgi:hypothetical protein